MNRTVSPLYALYIPVAIAIMTVSITFLMALFAVLSWIPSIRERCENVIKWGHIYWSLGLRLILPKLTYKYHGLENLPKDQQGAVVVANHSSLIDIPMLCCMRKPFTFVAKKSLWKVPIFGRALTIMGCIGVDRSSPESRKWTFQRAVECVQKGGKLFFSQKELGLEMAIYFLSRLELFE